MTGQDVKAQVVAQLEYADSPKADAAIDALAPCIVLTPEEAAMLRDHLTGAEPGKIEDCEFNCLALLTEQVKA